MDARRLAQRGRRLARRRLLPAVRAAVAAARGLGSTAAASRRDIGDHPVLGMRLAPAEQFRPFSLIAPGFAQVESTDPSPAPLTRAEVGPVAPFAAVVLAVTTNDTGSVVAGLVQDERHSVLAVYDADSSEARIEVTRGGHVTVAGAAPTDLVAPFRFAFVVCENQVTVLADAGDGLRPLVTSRDEIAELVDLRRPEVLREHRYGYGARSGDGSTSLGRVDAGYFGQVGVRDPHVVQNPDGTPVIRDGKLYLTLTNAGPGFFRQAHWGVWTLDLSDPTRLEQVAHLFFARDGLVLGDHAGQIVYDDEQDVFHLMMSSWGDFADRGVHVRHVTTDADVLAGVHVLSTARVDLPTSMSTWDPAFTRIDGRWYVAFVESPSQTPFTFHPALAIGPVGGGYDDLTLVGRDMTVEQTEGTVLQRVHGDWYLLASDGDARRYRVYDLAMRHLGGLDAPYGTNIPHPTVVPLSDRGRTRWLMLTFDGTPYAERVLGYGTHGDFVVMEGPSSDGLEFPTRKPASTDG